MSPIPTLSRQLLSTKLLSDTATVENTCGFEGDDNTYGLGIRIGIYVQWLATILTSVLIPEEASNMIEVNRSFTLSTFIALLYSTFNSRISEFDPFEPSVLMNLCLGGVFFSLPVTPFVDASNIGHLITLSLALCVSVYCGWFCSDNFNQVNFPCEVSDFHKTAMNVKICITLITIFFVFPSLFGMRWLVSVIPQHRWSSALVAAFGLNNEPLPDIRSKHDRTNEGALKYIVDRFRYSRPVILVVLQVLRIFSSIAVLFAIVYTTEFSIREKRIQGVTTLASTGQLIPLVVGSTGLLKVIYLVWRRRTAVRGRLTDLFPVL